MNRNLTIGVLCSFLINVIMFALLPLLNRFYKEEPLYSNPIPVRMIVMPARQKKPKKEPAFKPRQITIPLPSRIAFKVESVVRPIPAQPVVPREVELSPNEPSESASLFVPKAIYKVSEADQSPVKLEGEKPIYPSLARKLGIECTLFLKILIDEKGNVREVKVAKASSSASKYGFIQAAREAILKWRFLPANIKGKPVSVWAVQQVSFRRGSIE